MTFDHFQQVNITRSRIAYPTTCHTPEFLAVAIAGEAGEMCNLVKKVMRGDFTLQDKRTDILKELADVISYCDLFMSILEARTEHVLCCKFNEVSQRRGYKEQL